MASLPAALYSHVKIKKAAHVDRLLLIFYFRPANIFASMTIFVPNCSPRVKKILKNATAENKIALRNQRDDSEKFFQKYCGNGSRAFHRVPVGEKWSHVRELKWRFGLA